MTGYLAKIIHNLAVVKEVCNCNGEGFIKSSVFHPHQPDFLECRSKGSRFIQKIREVILGEYRIRKSAF